MAIRQLDQLEGSVPAIAGVPTIPASAIVVPTEFAAILRTHLGDAGKQIRELGDELRMAHINMMLRGNSQAQADLDGRRSWWAW